MNHLIISREYPPAAYPPGGIGAYVANIARLMAERGETVHVIGERWEGASLERETSHKGRLIVHRIGADDALQPHWRNFASCTASELASFKQTAFPNQWFSWHAAFLIEWLIEHENIDVIEGQEWEAPLYYFLLRRALGIGPQRHPPCIVHLHSTTEFIRRFNGAFTTPGPYVLMKRMEEYCIRAADALLCPSQYFARQCADRYEIPVEQIKVIRLPLGSVPLVEREHNVWARGSICFVGRLEPRKGVVEWIEAATRISQEHSEVEFDIVGADIWGLQRSLVGRIPRASRSRFRFHGAKTQAEIPGLLAGARAAVVPSRWENFPNVCIEAMGAGLPVIATRLGGMVELVEDGRTGWLTPDTGVAGMVDGLADALRRCLAASPAQRASMGRAAAEAVRQVCNNERTVEEQIAFRAEVARSGATQSVALPHPSGSALGRVSARRDCQGAGIIVRAETLSDAGPSLESIYSQRNQPRAVAVVYSRLPAPGGNAPAIAPNENTILLYQPDRAGADAWNAGLEALQDKGSCGFWVFLDEGDRLLPDYLSRIEAVFSHRAEVGIIAVWIERMSGHRSLVAPLCPDPEYQLRGNEVTSASAFRAEALGGVAPFRPGMPREYDVWDLANAVMAKGWRAVAYPEILAHRFREEPKVVWPDSTALRAIRAEILDRFSDGISRESLGLIYDHVPIPQAASDPQSLHEQSLLRVTLSCMTIVAFDPQRAARGIRRRSGAALTALRLHTGLWKRRSAV
jgi:glycosyltransferase involved in cell wall biosynthesis